MNKYLEKDENGVCTHDLLVERFEAAITQLEEGLGHCSRLQSLFSRWLKVEFSAAEQAASVQRAQGLLDLVKGYRTTNWELMDDLAYETAVGQIIQSIAEHYPEVIEQANQPG